MTRSIRDIQRIQLETLIDIRHVCEKHGLTYTLYCGTLLGCIRHGGFIPWDDDVDIAMPLADYRAFLKIFPAETSDKYAVESLFSHLYASSTWCKVCRKHTVYTRREVLHLRFCKGISVDIYPLIGAADFPRFERIQSTLLLACSAFRSTEYRKATGYRLPNEKQQRIIGLFDRLPRVIRYILCRLFLSVCMLDPGKHLRCGTIDAAPFQGKFTRSDLRRLTTGIFEGESFRIPAEYDRLLTIMYGDYMQLPPEWARTPHYSEETVIRIPEEILRRAPALTTKGGTDLPVPGPEGGSSQPDDSPAVQPEVRA